MFDEATIQLIAQAAPLSGLDLALLPQLLTEAYAQVVAARLGALDDDQQATEWSATTARLQRLAETYEGLAIFMEPGEPHRASCAFVAASAHFTLNQARRIKAAAGLQTSPWASLSTHGVSPEVAACLLFLIAEQQADAGEASKTFVAEDGSPVAQLLDGIRALASGEGRELARFASLPLTEEFGSQDDYLEQAARAVWLQLTRALQLVARCALGDQIDDPVVRILDVARRIENASAAVPIGDANAAQRLPLEGPYHLARLLSSATAKLLDSCVVITPAPDGVPPDRWVAFLKYFAAARPFLWRNHLLAIERGFLGSGTSFVLTFPTGAGKTTITALRIAVEVLRGRAVVYLVPTRALVDQVAKDLTTLLKTVAPDAVRGRFTEDYGETGGGAVYVQTPEQCLAY